MLMKKPGKVSSLQLQVQHNNTGSKFITTAWWSSTVSRMTCAVLCPLLSVHLLLHDANDKQPAKGPFFQCKASDAERKVGRGSNGNTLCTYGGRNRGICILAMFSDLFFYFCGLGNPIRCKIWWLHCPSHFILTPNEKHPCMDAVCFRGVLCK